MKNYSPLYFLAALGPGGLAVSFYVYLLFLIPHKGIPLATFEHISAFFQKSSLPAQAGIVLAVIGIVYFTYKHFALLVWNIRQWREFKKGDEYLAAKGSLKEVTFMAMPLTYAMTINVFFVLFFERGLCNRYCV